MLSVILTIPEDHDDHATVSHAWMSSPESTSTRQSSWFLLNNTVQWDKSGGSEQNTILVPMYCLLYCVFHLNCLLLLGEEEVPIVNILQ